MKRAMQGATDRVLIARHSARKSYLSLSGAYAPLSYAAFSAVPRSFRHCIEAGVDDDQLAWCRSWSNSMSRLEFDVNRRVLG